MGKTPTTKSQKPIKTPKTLPKKLLKTPNTERRKTESKLKVQWPKLEFEAEASTALSFCTPARTTRSMAKVVKNDYSHQLFVFTPTKSSKKETTESNKKSARKSRLVRSSAVEQNSDEFVQPFDRKNGKRTRKIKLNASNAVPSESDDEQKIEMVNKSHRKSASKNESPAMFSSEEDMPKSTPGKYVRAKSFLSIENNIDQVASSEDDMPSVSMLGGNPRLSDRFLKLKRTEDASAVSSEDDLPSVSMLITEQTPVKQVVYLRKSKHSINNQVVLSEDDLPSVSMLGDDLNTSGRFVRPRRKSMQTIENNDDLTDEDLPSVSMLEVSGSARSRKSVRKSARSSQGALASEGPLDKQLTPTKPADQLNRSRKSDNGRNEQVASNETDLLALVQPNDDEKMEFDEKLNEKKQASPTRDDQIIQSETVTAKIKDTVEHNSENVKSAEICIIVSSPKPKENTESNEHEAVIPDLPQFKNEKLFKNRISVIDLTDSPLPANKSVLNQTFTPEKESNDEKINAKDRTFTEEEEDNAVAINDKTFSPVPPLDVKKPKNAKFSTPTSTNPKTLQSAAKSSGKKSSTQVKRLQTPFRKARNNLATPSKLSSAKKNKMFEAAVELAASPKIKTSKKLQEPSVSIQMNPQIFKFGQDNGKNADFRFSLCAEHLKNNDQQKNVKSTVKLAPNFENMHNRMFQKAESIVETRNRHEQRAMQLLSGKKPIQVTTNKDEKPTQNKRAKLQLTFKEKVEERRPLAHVNRTRLNDEQRQERRKQLFKQGTKRKSVGRKGIVPSIKGVRLNRRFELMMQNRNVNN